MASILEDREVFSSYVPMSGQSKRWWTVQMVYKANVRQFDADDPEYWRYHVFAETEEEARKKVMEDRAIRHQPEADVRRVWEDEAVIW